MRTLKALLVIALLAAPARALVAPWYYVHAKLRAALEGPSLKVLELEHQEGRWVAPVVLVGPDADAVADALATVLNRSYLGGTVVIEVRYGGGRGVARPVSGGREAAVRTFATALKGNPHLSGVFSHGDGVLIELRPQLLQFYADNIDDRRGLAHLDPAAVFGELLDFSPFAGTRIRFSYSPVAP